jgi:hypothetical protein
MAVLAPIPPTAALLHGWAGSPQKEVRKMTKKLPTWFLAGVLAPLLAFGTWQLASGCMCGDSCTCGDGCPCGMH